MDLETTSTIAAYMLASIVCFTMEQGLRKTPQPVFGNSVARRIFGWNYPGFAAWLVSAFRQNYIEVLLRFVPINALLLVLALAGKASAVSALVAAVGLSLALAVIERVPAVNPEFTFALARRTISAIGAALSALAWLVILARF